MKYNKIRKELVLGIIMLFVGVSIASGISFELDIPVVLIDEKESMDTLETSPNILLYENFSGDFPPEGWSTDWWIQCNRSCGIDPPGACLIANQYENNSAYITSKAVDVSEYGKTIVTFYLEGSIYPNYCIFMIKLKTNETSSWKDVTPWEFPMNDWYGGYFEVGIYNCTGSCEALQIKFEYLGYEDYYSSFYLDDVKILGIPANNSAPEPPTIDGPTSGKPGIEYNYTFASCDPDGDDVYYLIDWDDDPVGEWFGPYPSCQIVEISQEWSEVGVYYITAYAMDIYGSKSQSDPYKVVIENEPPNAPTITGQTSGKAGKEYEFTFNATDPDGDNVKYLINWGDNTTYETDFNASDAEVKVKHTWSEDGTYNITSKAQDIYGAESPETTLIITIIIQRSRAVYHPLLLWFLERFPLLERFLSLFR
jgi:hypothetical protein